MENGLLTVLEYAEMKNVSVQSVYKRLKTGLKEYCVEIDGKKYIKRSALEQSAEQPEPKKEPDYSEDYVQSLLAIIERLESDKARLEHEKDELNAERKEQEAHIREMHRLEVEHKNKMDELKMQLDAMEKQIALQAAPAAETVEVVQPADAAEPELEKKKPWWKFW